MGIKKRTRDEHFMDPGPKRILSLDGGGVRGMMSLSVLKEIEDVLRERHGGDGSFRLCDYFDLIAGTSTGAIIAAALAKGLSVEEIQGHYRKLSNDVFKKSLFRQGFMRAQYDRAALDLALQGVLGRATTLGHESLRTGLLIVMKRIDSSSPWPISNNPSGRYYMPENKLTIPNRDYALWRVVRASTAAPKFFDPEHIVVAEEAGQSTTGVFVDGGVSTANNPSLTALRFVTLSGYRVGWKTGADQLLLVSVGTGLRNPRVTPSAVTGVAAIQSLLSIMDDCNAEVETMLQWMGRTDTARTIDREVGSLDQDAFPGERLLTYQRYNVELSEAGLNGDLELGLDGAEIDAIQEMDAPENLEVLERVGTVLARKKLKAFHFPAAFDLPRQGGTP